MTDAAGAITLHPSATAVGTMHVKATANNRLVSDMTAIPRMQEAGLVVAFDATHSVQEPGGLGESSGGERRFIAHLARAAVAAGADAIFMEVHPDPDCALCDGPNMWPLDGVAALVGELLSIRSALTAAGKAGST